MTSRPEDPVDKAVRSATVAGASLHPGQEIPSLDVGPLSLVDLVRWAGYQENWLRIHYDQAYAAQRRLPGIVQSGHHRTALIARMLTDWLGEAGELRSLRIRHIGLVRPGDAIACRGRIVRRADSGESVEVTLEVWVVRGDGVVVSEGQATGFFRHMSAGGRQ